MRAGANCAAQQTLSAEAASVLKHSLSLSRRRGHAQVTPLHVAATLLMSPRATLLRRACLKSQPHHQPSHPLQCRALELCFNVALNRLPATPAPLLHHAQPSLSNALVAALKRAQAHQRRGCVEQQQNQQQQPLITVKVELEQLIISILDDPSVSRVMREAGFSSTAVKNNLEDSNGVNSSVFQCYSTSGGIYSTPNSPPTSEHNPNGCYPTPHRSHHLLSYASSDNNPFLFSPQKKPVITINTASSSSFKDEVADYHQTYMKLQMKDPPLDIPLGLSLNAAATSGIDSKTDFPYNPSQDLIKKPFCIKEELQDHQALTCCPECLSNYEREAANFKKNSPNTDNGPPKLPFWLKKPHIIDTLHKDNNLVELRRKYNKLCQTLHQGSYNHTSSYPSWPNKNTIYADDSETISFANYPKFNRTASSLPRFRRQQSCHIDFTFSNNNNEKSSKNQTIEPNLDSLKGANDKDVKITLALGNSAYSHTPVTSHKIALATDLCQVFQENVPWQSETIPSILEALAADSKPMSKDTFILIEGNDFVGKRRFAVGIAEFMFGSSDLLFCMSLRKSSNNNREKLEKALRNQENIVVLIEDAECADYDFAEFLDQRYESGKLEMHDKEDHIGHAIFVLSTTDGDRSYDKSDKDVDYIIHMKLVVNESKRSPDKPNNESKRKAEWDLPIIRSKSQRCNDRNALDLNVEADEDVQRNSLSLFLEKIKNKFVMNRDSDKEEAAREMFLSKFRQSFKDVISGNITSFDVEETVLEEILRGSGLYLNSLFDRWLKEVFETSLRNLDSGGDKREKVISIRLCLGGKGENCPEDGFMGTCLPKTVSVSLTG